MLLSPPPISDGMKSALANMYPLGSTDHESLIIDSAAALSPKCNENIEDVGVSLDLLVYEKDEPNVGTMSDEYGTLPITTHFMG